MSSTRTGKQAMGRAVVIGGSIAGLLSARVLSDSFEEVVLLERDPPPLGPEPRKGAPQGRHVHAILQTGLQVMAGFFPGLIQQVQREGGMIADTSRDVAWFHFGSWKPRYQSRVEGVMSTRPFMEWLIYRRVAALPNVKLRHGCSVDGLIEDADRTGIQGVRVKGPEGEETLQASLVVDASGRGTRAPRWLEELGYGRPEQEEVSINLAYTSRFYERPPDFKEDWRYVLLFARPPESWRSGMMCDVEDGRWQVSLNGYFGDHPPTDDEGFLEYARTLPTRTIYDAIKNARPLTPPIVHKYPASRWTHYERLPRLPEGFIVLGDAACSFNPIYAQGMTVSALGARLLAQCLAEQARSSPGQLRGLSTRFQRRLCKVISTPWRMSTFTDLRYPQTQGRRPFGLRLVQWSMVTLIDMASWNVRLCHQLFLVVHMQAKGKTLMNPGILFPFLAYALKSLFVGLPRRANVSPLPPARL
ncbi:FAD-dependent oxidoreductase [Hyalangium gracile]|uniref:FAD-dependent oxidoreductase n=1 Tax=Hyalangium gracile TaxID=394092 RepID=UPI001CCD007B|nr:FAD-dependent monooxygenase [Hyalangium gracile]